MMPLFNDEMHEERRLQMLASARRERAAAPRGGRAARAIAGSLRSIACRLDPPACAGPVVSG